jgi:hypothetical protein
MTTTGVSMRVASKLTLLFAGIGAIAGCVSAVISSAGAALLIAMVFYYGSYKLALSMLGIAKPAPSAPSPTPPMPTAPPTAGEKEPLPDKRKVLTSGFIPFLTMWLVLWILVYTLKLTA